MKHIKYFQLTLVVVSLFFTWSCKEEESLPPLVSIDEYFASNNIEGYATTESGLRYKVLTEGNGDSAKTYDVVMIKMAMSTLKDVVVFDDSLTTSLDKYANLTSGMVEAVNLLSEKGKVSAFLPSKLAFAEYGWYDKIRPNEDVKIVITLDSIRMSIEKYIEENELTGMIKTSSGLYYKIIEEGTGALAQKNQTVSVDYKGAFLDGDVFDTSIGNKPINFVLGFGSVIKGWDEGIGYLKKGDKAILLIPFNLAYGTTGNSAIPPYEPLRFDVTLVDIQ